MKTVRTLAGCGVGLLLWSVCLSEGAPSLSVTKPPVQLPTLMTGPPIDPMAAQGQWFMDTNGVETVRTNEFYDEVAGGLGANAITGYVDNVVYQGGPGTPIQGFSIQATIHNDTTTEAGWAVGSNSHGESRPRIEELPYVGPLVDVKLAAEFAIGDASRLPLAFNYPAGPYREGESPFIEAINEDQWGWYCWSPEDPDPGHQPSGGYFVPTWDFGTIPQGQSATRQLVFSVAPPGLQPADLRYSAIVASHATQSDVLLNRSQSLKISTWIDDVALDAGADQVEPPLRLSDVSVFHNPYEEEEPEELDFGDAPDAPYPTLLASDGARHVVLPGFCLGARVDAESDGQPTANADGDDSNPPLALDDEDGVTFATALFPGVQSWVQVVASVPLGTTAYVSVWIDLNGDGDWTDPGEQVVADNGAVAGAQAYPFTPGAIAAVGSTFARVRLSTQQGLADTGLAPDGEVEDYEISIAPVKWLQEPDLSETGVDVDNFVLLADDFRCTQSGPITDFHVWTSFNGDELPPGGLTNAAFTLYLYADVPAQEPENPYSHPGALLWSREFAPGTYFAGPISAGPPEWWFDPVQGTWTFPGDTQVFQYDFLIPIDEAYVQTTGTVYWLGVKYDEQQPGGFQLGWKSSTNHWNDDACWFDPDGRTWHELRYGGGHPLAGDSMDLAFAVTGLEGDDPTLDFGDAPDTPYPTLRINDGARHVVVPGIYMGALIDAEYDGQPDATATGDDLANLKDEDGVTFLNNWVAGQVVTVQVVASVSGIVSAWVDFDANGSWGDFGENVLAGAPVGAGTNVMVVNVPASSNSVSTFARFRFTTMPVAMTYTGLVADGEVEDYALTILQEEEEELDFGDADDSLLIVGYPTLLANNGARHVLVPGVFLGASIDAEPDGQPDGTATGDDNAGIDDEDGVTLPAMLAAGSSVQVPVMASVPGFLNAWIDWNCNGTWLDPGEQVFLNHPLVPGINPLPLSVPLPPAFVAGGPQSRWRFTTYPVAVPAFAGAETDGEVEDYELQLEILDFGDAPDPTYPTLLANNGACHRIPSIYYLGATAPDLDPDGQPTPDAMGDDNAGTADEDGVFMPGGTPLVRGDPSALLGVVVSTAGNLNAWLDFNGDGDWADAGEQIAADLSLPAGVNPLVFAIPADAWVGSVVGRFRFSSLTGLSYAGFASDGEVEDHVFTIYQQGPDTNNFEITNIVYAATNQATIWWVGDTNAIYETQYILDLPSTSSPPWTPWGAWVTGGPLMQVDTNAAETAKHYRVVAPFSPPPP
jgi:hypothetical protein